MPLILLLIILLLLVGGGGILHGSGNRVLRRRRLSIVLGIVIIYLLFGRNRSGDVSLDQKMQAENLLSSLPLATRYAPNSSQRHNRTAIQYRLDCQSAERSD